MAEMQQKDLVLSPNEYAYLLDRTKGIVSCYVGPIKTSLSNTDSPVRFNPRSKRFEECYLDEATSLFMTAPENWYIILKNPESEGKHPALRSANELPKLDVGKKVNITGPVSFALYPGQMARAVQGHRLRSNQYLLVRVYDEESAKANWNNSVIKTKEAADASNQTDETKIQVPESAAEGSAASITELTSDDLSIGKIMVIKGTEVSFYIPPTGIEVLPTEKHGSDYIRDAVTLERLEYCILKDEDGNKRYVHGPAVVFPEPTESFLENGSTGNYKFRAIELSKISGIYVKVIADYEEGGKLHKVGEELFITGKDQMIYYPRPEHAIITYGDRIVHHAVAIPAGEGRYVMDRMTGEITTVKGPKMFLPDPRTQVIVKRKLTRNQATLWYPGNDEVLRYNELLDETSPKHFAANSVMNSAEHISRQFSYSGASAVTPLELAESSMMNRGTTFTPPRTITIDNKFEGVVAIDVWTGYAVNVVSKDGSRKVVVGPCTNLMDYDQTLEVLEMSTGKPKTTDRLLRTVYLRVENNKISDIIKCETKDFVSVDIKVSYCVDFLEKYKDKWFSVENYVKYLCDRIRSLMKREAKKYTIEEFYQNATDIVRKVALNIPDPNSEAPELADKHEGRLFSENGMLLHDVEVLSVHVDEEVADILQEHQQDAIRKSIELADAEQRIKLSTELAAAETKIAKIKYDADKQKLDLEAELALKRISIATAEQKSKHDQDMAKLKAEQDSQKISDQLFEADAARTKKVRDAEIAYREKLAEIDKQRNEAYAEAVVKMMAAVSPQLAASIEQLGANALFADVAQKMSPLAIVNGESIADTSNKLLKGTAFEGLLSKFLGADMSGLVDPKNQEYAAQVAVESTED